MGPIYDEDGKQVCGGKLRHREGTCRNPPVPGRNRCKWHGGKTPVGIASPHFKHGRTSTYMDALPDRMRGDFTAAMLDPDLLRLTEQVAVVDTRLLDLMRTANVGVTTQLWRDLRAQWRAFKVAQGGGDVPGMNAAITAMDSLIQHGASEAAAWDEIGKQIDRSVRVREAEQKRRIAMELMVDMNKLDNLKGQILGAIKAEVTDRETLVRLAERLSQVM
jgi:hypothetical protein